MKVKQTLKRCYQQLSIALFAWLFPLLSFAVTEPASLVDILNASGTTGSGDSLKGVAGGLFTPPLTDKSVFLLQQLFGSVGNALEGTGSQIVGQMFAVFNLGIWVVAGGFVMYTTLMSIVNTAKDGQFLGRSQMSAWVAVRTVGGIAMLLPKFTGYSFIQVLVISVVLQGVGLADHLWAVSVNYVASGGALYSVPAGPTNGQMSDDEKGEAAKELTVIQDAAHVLRSELCFFAVDGHKRQGESTSGTTDVSSIYETEGMINFGPSCGSYTWPRPPSNVDAADCLANGSGTHTDTECSNAIYSRYVEVGLKQVVTDLLPVAEFLIKNSTAKKQTEVINITGNKDVRTNTSMMKCLRCINLAADVNFDSIESNPNFCLGEDLAQGAYCNTSYQLLDTATNYMAILNQARRAVANYKAREQNQSPKSLFPYKDKALKSGWLMAGPLFLELTNPKLRGEKLGSSSPLDEDNDNFRFKITLPTQSPPGTDPLGRVLPLSGSGGDTDTMKMPSALRIKLSDGTHWSWAERLTRAYRWLGLKPPSSMSGARSSHKTTDDVDNILTAYTADIVGDTDYRFRTFLSQAYGIYMGLHGGAQVKEQLGEENTENSQKALTKEQIVARLKADLEDTQSKASGESDAFANISASAAHFDLKALTQLMFDMVQTPIKTWINVNLTHVDSDKQDKRIAYEDPVRRLRVIGMSMINAGTTFWDKATKEIFSALSKAAGALQGELIGLSILYGLIGMKLPALADALMQATSSTLTLFFQIAVVKYFWFMPLAVAISVPIFVMGITLSVYTPMIPYIIFTFASIGWLISVIEAMVAAPLIALGVTHPEGHDLMGKAEQALMLLLSVFIRPAAILMGFIIAIILSFVSLNLLDEGFFQVMLGQISAYGKGGFSAGSTNMFVSLGGMMIIYTFVVVAIVNQSFSLVYVLPSKLMRWIGGPVDQPTEAQLLQEVKAGFKDQAQQMAQGGGQMVSGMKGAISPPGQRKAATMKKKDDKKGDGVEVKNN